MNIYYRGANLMEVRQPSPRSSRLTGRFDRRYLQKYAARPWGAPATAEELAVHEWLDGNEVLGLCELEDRAAVERHVASFAYRRAAMDANMVRRPKPERDAQQKIVRANSAVDSQYVICDIEYSFRGTADESPAAGSAKTSRIDAVAAYRPDRDSGDKPARLALIELKWGTHAIDGRAGLREHVSDLGGLLDLGAVAAEMTRITQQKSRLGILPAPVASFESAGPVDYIIAVCAHNPRSQCLCDALLGRKGLGDGRLVPPEGIGVKVALLNDSHVLRHADLIPLEDITDDNVPLEICCRPRRDRRPGRAEMMMSGRRLRLRPA